MNTQFGLTESVLEKIRSVLKHYSQIDKAVLYGSRAWGNYRENSDIDLTLFGDGITLNVFSRISHELDDLLLPYIIDIAIYQDNKNASLLEQINNKGITIYEKGVSKRL